MPLQPQVTFRNLDMSESVKGQIESRVVELERVYDRIVACNVVIEKNRHRHNLYQVTVHLVVPGGDIVVKHEPSQHHANEDLRLAVKDAFDAARRQLEDHARRVNGRVKTHEPAQETGRIARLIADQGYGFIATGSGDEIYMHRNAVVGNGFAALEVGDEVRYVTHPGEGEHGPQASTVIPVGKHHSQPTLS